MTKAWLIRLVLAGICLLPLSALADQDGPGSTPEFGLEEGLTFGGRNLLVSGVTGQPALTPHNVSLYAGDTIYMQGYYRQALGRTGVSLKAAGGFQFACEIPTCLDQLAAEIGNNGGEPYQFGGLSGDVALEYAWDDGRVGIGRTIRASNLLFSTSNVYAFKDVYLRPAYGWFVEYEYDRVGVRYTHLIYRSYSGYALNGSNLGVYLHFNYRDEDWYPGGKYFEQGEGMARESLALVFHPKEWSL